MTTKLRQVVALNKALLDCTACTIRQEACTPVPPVGSISPIMMVGRNPGRDEDVRGEPFTGPSGKILDVFLGWAGLTRGNVFLTNLVNCHTLDDRLPSQQETQTCARLWVLKYIAAIQPKLVVTMGAEASRWLARVSKISKVHGDVLKHASGFYVMPIYHPGAVLYDPRQRDNLIYDAARLKKFLELHPDIKEEAMRVPRIPQLKRQAYVPWGESPIGASSTG